MPANLGKRLKYINQTFQNEKVINFNINVSLLSTKITYSIERKLDISILVCSNRIVRNVLNTTFSQNSFELKSHLKVCVGALS